MNSTFSNLLIANAVFTWLIQRVKDSPWFPWINRETQTINHLLSALAATLLAAGIAATSSWDISTHTFVLTISGLTLANVLHFSWSIIGNYVMQKGWFKVLYGQNQGGKAETNGGTLPKAA